MASASAPLNYFLHAHGPAAGPTMLLGWIFAGIATATCCIVAGLLWRAIGRRRPQGDDDNAVLVQGGPSGLKWVAIGSGISAAILLGMTVYALAVLNQVAARPAGPVIDVTVTAYDWWWRIDYPAADGNAGFVTANELHIPVGVPVRLRLESADVIHAFWVPQLAGKTQAIPGLHNEQWLQADRPGVYAGQCTQYCGVQHAHMAFEVVAEPPARYAAWRAAQALPAAPLSEGGKLFNSRCGGCHTVRGSAAAGGHGPDLTHLLSRRTIAAGALVNTPANLMSWITHAQAVKPGNRMPSMALDDAEAAQLGAYLALLQ